MFSRIRTKKSMNDYFDEVRRLKEALAEADTVIIGAGSGLSTSAGFTYSGERFEKYFPDFISKYGFSNMYSGGFYPFPSLEEYWGYWSRYIFINRYMDTPRPVYENLLKLVSDKDCFVITTNVDHCFQKAGFDKKRLFYTQGDYGLFQCSDPCCRETFDNEEIVRQMLAAQGWTIRTDGSMCLSEESSLKMSVPTELVPHCPHCGQPMTMNLRADDTFVEDAGWHEAAARYKEFLRIHKGGKILYLELGVGSNTPVIIKYPFWQMTAKNPDAVYACLNYGEAYAPEDIRKRSVCINGDIGEILSWL